MVKYNESLNTIDKLDDLRDKLREYGSLAVAFSGGVDSTFLLLMAKETIGDRVIAITVKSPAFSKEETDEAIEYCRGNNIRHIEIEFPLDEIEGFLENPKNRCYLCKKSIFTRIVKVAKEEGTNIIADGSNWDDISDYRPGMVALEELKIKSPLKEVGLTKIEIRNVLKKKGLSIWEKPSYACLATRIPYGQPITEVKLNQIENFEKALHLLKFNQIRVRHHGEVARIEVLPDERERFFDIKLLDEINEIGKNEGFKYVSFDLAGYKMGNLNF